MLLSIRRAAADAVMERTEPLSRLAAAERGTGLGAVAVAARASSVLLFGVVPAGLLLALLWVSRDSLAVDLHHAFRPAAEAVLAGRSPYPSSETELAGRDAFVYLPPAAFAFTPFALLPPLVADVLGMALMLGAGAAALAVLGVRDPRCYGAALAAPPVLAAVQTANVTLLLTLALAVVWATRGRRLAPGLALGLTLATKVVLWPLLVWLVATRRSGAALVAAASATALVCAGWAAIGFAGLGEHPHLLRALTDTLGGDAYTAAALAADLGAGEAASRALALTTAASVLAAAVVLGRRGDDARSFGLAVLAALLFSPLVWLHSFTLLLVPVAIVHRRFSALWLLPLVFWAGAPGTGNGSTAATALALATALAVVGLSLRAARRGGPLRPAC
jgi:alpha-1,2-mannosyltransferase